MNVRSAATGARIAGPSHVACAVALALRCIPDVQREFRTISQVQQARGMAPRSVGLGSRFRNLTPFLAPLLLGSCVTHAH